MEERFVVDLMSGGMKGFVSAHMDLLHHANFRDTSRNGTFSPSHRIELKKTVLGRVPV